MSSGKKYKVFHIKDLKYKNLGRLFFVSTVNLKLSSPAHKILFGLCFVYVNNNFGACETLNFAYFMTTEELKLRVPYNPISISLSMPQSYTTYTCNSPNNVRTFILGLFC